MIRAVQHVAAMAPYALPCLDVPKDTPIRSLAQNESLRAPSPLAVQAMAKAAAGVALYPDPDWSDLRSAVAEVWHLNLEDIVCGCGSLELIGALMRLYAGPDGAVLAPAYAYPYFRTAAGLAGARYDTAPETHLTADVGALLQAVRPDTRVLCLANPGNPTGTRLNRADILALRSNLPDHVLLVLDEAYGEFADHLSEPCFDMVSGGNTVVLRTLSKAYGLAGARVGWGVFPAPIAGEMRKVLGPNSVSSLAQAGAVAAFKDQAYMRETCALTAELRNQATMRLRLLGLQVPDSLTNFVLIPFENADQARKMGARLQEQGVILRQQAGVGLPPCLRMTLGPQEWVHHALELMEQELTS